MIYLYMNYVDPLWLARHSIPKMYEEVCKFEGFVDIHCMNCYPNIGHHTAFHFHLPIRNSNAKLIEYTIVHFLDLLFGIWPLTWPGRWWTAGLWGTCALQHPQEPHGASWWGPCWDYDILEICDIYSIA